MEFNSIKLSFTGPLHIGRGIGQAYDTSDPSLHSDTLSGALASGYVTLFGSDGLQGFMNAYRVSSAFPFDGKTFFFPVPKGFRKFSNPEGADIDNKVLKKIAFVDLHLFNLLLGGKSVPIKPENLSPDRKLLYSRKAPDYSIFKDHLTEKVFVPRMGGSDTVPFHFERKYFSENCGFFFLYKADTEIDGKFFKILEYLSLQGFGTDKSIGNGQFSFIKETIHLDLPPAEQKQSLLLSLYCPTIEEAGMLHLDNSFYELIRRGGFMAGTSVNRFRHLRKKSVYMFSEASIISGFAEHPAGVIVNLRPEWNDPEMHPVYRDGRAFAIPLTINDHE